MANNLFQIKRSTTTDAPPILANGELAVSFTDTSNSVFVGNPRDVVPGAPLRIGGGKYSFLHQTTLNGDGEGGVLTANAVVVTNANNFLDQFKVNTLVVGPDGTTNTSATLVVSGSGDISGSLAVGGDLTVTGNTYYTSNVNFDGGVLFVDSVNNRVGIGNTAPDATLAVAGNANISGNVVLGGSLHTITGNVDVDSRTLFIDATNNRVGINTNTTNLDASLVVIGSANVSGAVTLANTLATTGAATFSNTVGITGATTLANTLSVTGNVSFSDTLTVSGTTSLVGNVTMSGILQTVAGNVNFDVGTLFVDATNNRVGVNTTTPDASISVVGTANISGNSVIGGKLAVTGAATLSNTFAVTGAATLSNTIAVTGAATFSNTVAITGNLAVDSNVLLVDTVNNRVGINDASPATALSVGGDGVISANLTANNLLVNADATINGNLYVNGILTTIDTVNLVVEDPLFKLAKNNNVANNAGDVVDLGFYAMYANSTANMYTGVFRDATDGKYRIFSDLDTEPTTTVDTSSLSYKTATLVAYLESGALSSNASALAITANSSYSVSIAANTISLSSALAVDSGGTGRQTFTTAGVVFGNGTSALQVTSAGANGDVLQVINNIPTFSTLDGGTF